MMELEEGVYAAEKIVKERTKKGKKEYYVKWVGCTPDQNTWEPAKNIYDKRLIAAFEQSQQKSPGAKRGRKPKQVQPQQQHTERQVLPFRGGHAHNRAVSSSSGSGSSSCSSEDEEDNNEGSARDNGSVSTSSDSSSSSSSSEDEEEAEESEEEKKPVKGNNKARGKPKPEPAAKKSASQSNAGSGPRSTSSPMKEKSPIRESLKRKAEVIQESGKIGVTITTTPKTSPTAGNGPSHPFGHDLAANVVEAAAHLLSLKHGMPSHGTTNHTPPAAKVARTVSNASAGSASGKPSRPHRAAAGANATNGTSMHNGNGHGQPPYPLPEPDALPAEYWINKQPLADQIVLTDVTVNLTTITVRECKTQEEFFKGAAATGIDDSKLKQAMHAITDTKK